MTIELRPLGTSFHSTPGMLKEWTAGVTGFEVLAELLRNGTDEELLLRNKLTGIYVGLTSLKTFRSVSEREVRAALATLPRGRPMTECIVTRIGSAVRLSNTGDLNTDIAAAIEAAGGPDFSPDDIRRIRVHHAIEAGLRAEAGYSSGGGVTIFATHTEVLANGKRFLAWLMLMPSPHGDIVAWNGTLSSGDAAFMVADIGLRDQMLKLIREVAGGPSTEVSDYIPKIPSDADLSL